MTGHAGAVAPELVACIAGGRDATLQELARMADRIARELSGMDPGMGASGDADDGAVRLISYRVAQAALVGDLDSVRGPSSYRDQRSAIGG